jgi:hypothetical protein
MRLEIRFSNRPLESLVCPAVAILTFSNPDSEKGMPSGLYDRMRGFWPCLEETDFWSGARGETLLLASDGLISADKILLKGLGESTAFDAINLTDRVGEVGAALDGIGVREFGISIPTEADFEEAYASQLELAARHLVEPFLENHQDDAHYRLKIIFSLGAFPLATLTPVILRLRRHFASIKDLFIGEDRVIEMAEVGGG